MINEHDIKAFKEELRKELIEDPPEIGDNMLEAIIKKTASLLAVKCDAAWYYDAANLIRAQVGIPISCMSPCQKHGIWSDNYEEGL